MGGTGATPLPSFHALSAGKINVVRRETRPWKPPSLPTPPFSLSGCFTEVERYQTNCRIHLHARGGSVGVLVLKIPVKAGCLAAVKTPQERRRAETRRLAI